MYYRHIKTERQWWRIFSRQSNLWPSPSFITQRKRFRHIDIAKRTEGCLYWDMLIGKVTSKVSERLISLGTSTFRGCPSTNVERSMIIGGLLNSWLDSGNIRASSIYCLFKYGNKEVGTDRKTNNTSMQESNWATPFVELREDSDSYYYYYSKKTRTNSSTLHFEHVLV